MFRILANDGKLDRLVQATPLLKQHLNDVSAARRARGQDPTPDIADIEATHHLFVNAADVPERYTIPRNDQYKHFDRGQSESLVFLPPGKYTLTLQFGDGAHRSYGEKYRKKIEITVVPDKD